MPWAQASGQNTGCGRATESPEPLETERINEMAMRALRDHLASLQSKGLDTELQTGLQQLHLCSCREFRKATPATRKAAIPAGVRSIVCCWMVSLVCGWLHKAVKQLPTLGRGICIEKLILCPCLSIISMSLLDENQRCLG